MSEMATLGGGCFWCLDAVFRMLRGVEKVEAGFAGGHVPNPTYEQVCTGTTGHAEVARITFDPSVISYGDLLDVFFTIHDPTTVDRQGGDVGPQYRSVIFARSREQERMAREKIEALDAAGTWGAKAVTQVQRLEVFYPAESYHQDYFAHNKDRNPYCQAVIAPKVSKARKTFLDKLAG